MQSAAYVVLFYGNKSEVICMNWSKRAGLLFCVRTYVVKSHRHYIHYIHMCNNTYVMST